MSTLLLVGEDVESTTASAAPSSSGHRGPSLKRALERAGYQVVKVGDGIGAIARVEACPPDLIVMSGTVPDMELRELCAALRRDPRAEKVPFVLVADAATHSGRSAPRPDADLVFPPTVGPAEIADRLRRLF